MIELHAAYEIAKGFGAAAQADYVIEQVVKRDLLLRGLTSDDIISRERIEDGAEVEYDVAGEKRTFLRYCDKIIIPGDE